ncbi:hypothetical protein BKA82DRAFT_1007474 [Pisolithus tinctorius]|uniref:Uncharacterized protein n=1 Tax=Pisolithus tinctorius Marx 270 TaxID=870435 RepID=A0A0C3NJ75_PISTI|nr:hypothetical protein BKA82DRAFT_1007474 [Pisolithus tinctorius]KIN95428.1 hypothetical protein M404DRAFT_1007474 [Pisolithus tinctorius Marx 270]
MTSHCNGSYAQCAARFTSVGGRGMAPSSKPRSACRPPKHTSHYRCEWIKEDGTRCNTSITYDCARHLGTAHGIRQKGRSLRVLCCWCSPPKPIRRSGVLRHVREVHLKCPRSS